MKKKRKEKVASSNTDFKITIKRAESELPNLSSLFGFSGFVLFSEPQLLNFKINQTRRPTAPFNIFVLLICLDNKRLNDLSKFSLKI